MRTSLLLLVGVAAGLLLAEACLDDRDKVAAALFQCNPSMSDDQCGEGYTCYGASQSIGGSICVPRCDPKKQNADCENGICTLAGECLRSCTVKANDCPEGLSCGRKSISPLDPDTNDGVCVPVAQPCSNNDQCGSPIFNTCSNTTNRSLDGPGLRSDGNACVQGRCGELNTACQPGSACVRSILPEGVAAPDVCAPACVRRNGVNECLIGLTCLADAFPQTTTPVCSPGFPGWLCTDDLGCTTGSCKPWAGVAPDLRVCSARCNSDADCLAYEDVTQAPTFFTRLTCSGGSCHSSLSLAFGSMCVAKGSGCKLDPAAVCTHPGGLLGDGGVTARDPCSVAGGVGFPGFGDALNFCVRDCVANSDCAMLSERTHVPHACVVFDLTGKKICAPSLPFVTPCDDSSTCLPGLSCLQPNPLQPRKTCTRDCASDADCASAPALGSNFTCFFNHCVPKVSSGCDPYQPGVASHCLGGSLGSDGKCKSSKDWVCASGSECASGKCTSRRCE